MSLTNAPPCHPWWRDDHDFAQHIPLPERTFVPKLPAGCYDYEEIACMREQVWAEREGLC
jgi:hypothetical protein